MSPRQSNRFVPRISRSAVRRLIARFAREARINPAFIRYGSLELFERAFEDRTRERRASGHSLLDRDLAAVHRWEQLELLRMALEIQLGSSLEGRFLSAPVTAAPSEDLWRERCTEEIGCALADGACVDGELLACAMQDRKHWSSALQLAQYLDSMALGVTDQWFLARALFCEGQHEQAGQVVERMDLSRLTRQRRSSLVECLALDFEQRGFEWSALKHFEMAAVLGERVRTDLSATLLAMELGSERAVQQNLSRLSSRPDAACMGAPALLELLGKRSLMQRPVSSPHLYQLERALSELSSPALGPWRSPR